MTGWIYLIRNKDLYKIGITKNFKNRMRQLKPDNVVAKLYTRDFIKIERELHHRYKKFRIPQSEYFRLENIHIKEIKKIFSYLDNTSLEIFIKISLFLLIIFSIVFIFLYLYINDINDVLQKSILWIEKISFFFSFLSLFFDSGYDFGLYNEIKYRTSRIVFFIVFGSFFRILNIFLQ